MDIRNVLVKCENCKSEIKLSPSVLKEQELKDLSDTILVATYVECSVCGERILKQLDTVETLEFRDKVVKLKLLQKRGKLSNKDKQRLLTLDRKLNNIRKNLNKIYWDEVYQFLNKQTG